MYNPISLLLSFSENLYNYSLTYDIFDIYDRKHLCLHAASNLPIAPDLGHDGVSECSTGVTWIDMTLTMLKSSDLSS